MDLKTFKEYTSHQRRAEYLKKTASKAYRNDPIGIEKQYADVNDTAVNGLTEKRGSENYTCAGKVYSPFRVKRKKTTGRFEKTR